MSTETMPAPALPFEFSEFAPQQVTETEQPHGAIPFGTDLMLRATIGEHPQFDPATNPTASRLTFPQNTSGTTRDGKADTKPDIGTDKTD